MVQDIKAVNAFIAAGKVNSNVLSSNATDADCISADTDYIEGSTVPNQPAGAFWAVLNRLLIIFQVIVLILSEIGWPAAFFNKYFPVLGDEFGLGALGVIQCLLGAAVLSHHVDEFTLVSAFFLFSIGCLNIFLGLIFRESAKARRAGREPEHDDGLPRHMPPRALVMSSYTGGTAAWDKGREAPSGADAARATSQRSGMGFGRQGEKAALARGFTITRPVEALPTYVPKPVAEVRPTSAAEARPSSARTSVSDTAV
ncbi:hypothetical protein A0H81_05460 [Grifola frondosa]|uniref:DUF7598 domain-containing protein n=1 Tax=Grifola frondosa TaxID=5627 RepID=A0A1C7MCR2_GRIFR|nr:hypothetical protein A0H81_05460 [Grifola frondosa]